MKRKRSIGLSVGICLLLLGLFSNISVFAAVTEGESRGDSYRGVCSYCEYGSRGGT